MNDKQIIISIIVGTSMMALMATFIAILVAKYHKLAVKFRDTKKDLEDTIFKFNNNRKMCESIEHANEDLRLAISVYRGLLPLTPILKSIPYYKERKNVEVHAIIESIGMAVISDINQMNYKTVLIGQLGDAIDDTAEKLVGDLIEDTTPVELDGIIKDLVRNLIDEVNAGSVNNLSINEAKTLVDKNRLLDGELLSTFFNEETWKNLLIRSVQTKL
jgi:hypothetical protein